MLQILHMQNVLSIENAHFLWYHTDREKGKRQNKDPQTRRDIEFLLRSSELQQQLQRAS